MKLERDVPELQTVKRDDAEILGWQTFFSPNFYATEKIGLKKRRILLTLGSLQKTNRFLEKLLFYDQKQLILHKPSVLWFTRIFLKTQNLRPCFMQKQSIESRFTTDRIFLSLDRFC